MFRWLVLLIPAALFSQALPGTAPLEWKGDGADLIVGGIDRFLDSYSRPPGKPGAARLAHILGVVEPRLSRGVETSAVIARGRAYTVRTVRWECVKGLWGEGLLLEPTGRAVARVVALGDADWTPEVLAGLTAGVPAVSQFARRLVESGAVVVVPLLMDRKSTYSGVPGVRMTNMPHREFLWRQAYLLGRHIIGVEIQKVLGVVDWFAQAGEKLPLSVVGYGEGGLLALHAAALDGRIDGALVSGYFGPRDELWKEPVYRDVWGLLPDYRDSALAAMIAPRKLIVEAAPGPVVTGPPAETKDRRGAAPHGALAAWCLAEVEREVARVSSAKPQLVRSDAPGSEAALTGLPGLTKLRPAQPRLTAKVDGELRFERQFEGIITYFEHVIKESPKARAAVWAKADRSSPERWVASTRAIRDQVWDDMIGRLPAASVPANPRTRLVFDEPKFRGYEVVLDVWPGVNAYGYLLVPKDIRPGERRVAVVCQHGLEGRPKDVADPGFRNPTYNQFAVRLAEQGFVTFSPQNPYVLGDRFRQMNRKAHAWRLTQFSFVAGQHARILEWLGALDFVDAKRIGFYGLSYGGFTAMRIPALLDGYALSICSGNFTEWVWKVASLDAPFTYPFTGEYDIPEFNFANLVNHFELATLVFPRPFYVERGHRDGVSNDEWVAYEYAKVFRFYVQMGLGARTAIEYFDGPHEIHGVGTYEFLRKELGQGR